MLLVTVLMHKFYAVRLDGCHGSEDGHLLVVVFMLWAAPDVLFKVQPEEGFVTVWALLRLCQRFFLVFDFLKQPLIFLTVFHVSIEQGNIQNTHTNGTLFEEFLVVAGFWEFFLAHNAMSAGYVVLHRAVRA